MQLLDGCLLDLSFPTLTETCVAHPNSMGLPHIQNFLEIN